MKMIVATNLDKEACSFIKKRLQHRCFVMNIAKLSKTTVFKNSCERLLLWSISCRIRITQDRHNFQYLYVSIQDYELLIEICQDRIIM